MGKRSNFERVPRDYYPTPFEAVVPLLEHGQFPKRNLKNFTYTEPCAGDGRLVDHIAELMGGYDACRYGFDIEPRRPDIIEMDVFSQEAKPFLRGNIITNPPWNREFLHPFIARWLFTNSRNVALNDSVMWLLFDADWMHTKQSRQFMAHCDRIISVGRIKWIEGSKNTGKDNCCWYRFRPCVVRSTHFKGR